jgi:hypothetical protein
MEREKYQSTRLSVSVPFASVKDSFESFSQRNSCSCLLLVSLLLCSSGDRHSQILCASRDCHPLGHFHQITHNGGCHPSATTYFGTDFQISWKVIRFDAITANTGRRMTQCSTMGIVGILTSVPRVEQAFFGQLALE